MAERRKIQLLVALLAVAAGLYLYERGQTSPAPSDISADTHFVPLNVEEPALRVGLLNDLQRDEYKGTQRNIFIAGPLPPPPGAARAEAPKPQFVGPEPPPPPPPLQVPVEFYGIEGKVGGKQVALFKTQNGDDAPLIVAEGDTFMSHYRLLHIGNQSAEVEEVGTGRHATLPLVQAQDQAPTQ